VGDERHIEGAETDVRRCSTCVHPERAAIDTALRTETYRAVADRYRLSPSSLHRHWSNHGHLLARIDQTLAAIRERRASADDALFDLALFLAEYCGNDGVAMRPGAA